MICIQGLGKTLRGRRVLDNITMDIPAGQVTGLAGPNGCGKTMLMRAIVGLIRPSEGTVSVNGCDPWAHSLGEKNSDHEPWPDIGLLLEGPAFLDAYTGLQNLQIIAAVRGGIDEAEMRRALDSVGLDSDDPRKYRAYSLGMRQRLGIASATMGNPDVLILDEPTNALDAHGVEQVVELIKAAAQRGATVILAAHDADVLRGLSQEIWYLAEGHMDGHEVLGQADESAAETASIPSC